MARPRHKSLDQKAVQALKLFCLLLAGHHAQSQQVIEGIVRDSSGATVANANIYVHLTGNQKIISYAYSDRLGKYNLAINDPGEYMLNASALSYKPAQIVINVSMPPKASAISQDITLNPSPFELSEVILNAAVPVLIKRDTISINTEHFVDGSEQVVEDVLRKLPGIEVSGDGTIKVQGKSIEKVMVDGDDLFEKGYRLLTKNLHASVIQNVEIIDKYSENSLLKQVEETDKIALNLILKPEIKGSLFGNISLGYGNREYYEEKANLISYLDKTKYYLLGNFNNMGTDVTGDMFQLLYPHQFSGATYIGDGQKAELFTQISGYSPPIDQSRYHYNDSELLSFNTIYKPRSDLKFKGLCFFSADETDLFGSSTTSYDIPPTAFSNTETYALRKSSRALSGKWDVIFSPDTISRLEYTGYWNTGNFDTRTMLLFNTKPLSEKLESRTVYHDHRFTLTRKIKAREVFQLTWRFLQDDKPSDYRSNTFLLRALFPSEIEGDTLTQQSRSMLKFIGVEAAYLKRTARYESRLDLGYSQRLYNLSNRLNYGEGQEVQENDSIILNGKFDQTFQDIYGRYKFRYGIRNVSWRFEVDAHQLHSETRYDTNIKSQRPLIVVPRLGLGWELNRANKFLATYTYNTVPIPFERMLPGYVLSGLQTLHKGIADFELMHGDFYMLSYTLGNWSEALFLNSSFMYNRENKYLGTNEIIHSNYTLSTPLSLKNKKFYALNIAIDAFVGPLITNFKLKANISGQNYQTKLNASGLQSIQTNTQQYGFELRSAFSGVFNFHLGSEWTLYKVSGFGERTNIINNSFLDLQNRISETFHINIRNESYHVGRLRGVGTCFFTDINAQLEVIPQKMQMHVKLRNLWDTRDYTIYNINDSGSYNASYDLLPRSLLLSFTYRF